MKIMFTNEEFCAFFRTLWFNFKEIKFFSKMNNLKNKLWFKYKLKEDEFHPTLNFDAFKYMKLSKEEKKKYIFDLIKKRNLAHELDMTKDV